MKLMRLLLLCLVQVILGYKSHHKATAHIKHRHRKPIYELDENGTLHLINQQNSQDIGSSLRFSNRQAEIQKNAPTEISDDDPKDDPKDDTKSDFNATIAEIQSDDPNLIYEGWLRLALMTPVPQMKYPGVQGPHKDLTEFQFLNKTDLDLIDSLPNFGEIPLPDAFFFRINKQHQVYYTETKTDTVVLGAMDMKAFVPNPTANQDCFVIQGGASEEWLLCSTSGKCPENWKGGLSQLFGSTFAGCPKPDGDFKSSKMIIKKKTVIQPMMVVMQEAPSCKFDYDYNLKGKDWVCNCNEGKNQSPVSLPLPNVCQLEAPYYQMAYLPVDKKNLELIHIQQALRIRTTTGNFGTLTSPDGDQVFEAKEIVFHTPGEHEVDGVASDFEVQILHETTSGDFKRQAVLAFVYKRVPGAMQEVFTRIDYMNLPDPSNNKPTDIIKTDLHVMDFLFDTRAEIPDEPKFAYYTYQGSITQPPCAEHITWIIATKQIDISSTIIGMFRDALVDPTKPEQRFNFGNNRLVQPLGDRDVSCFVPKDCDENLKKNTSYIEGNKMTGHFEKVQMTSPQYFYVDSLIPSESGGTPLSEKEVIDLGLDPKDPYPDVYKDTDKNGNVVVKQLAKQCPEKKKQKTLESKLAKQN